MKEKLFPCGEYKFIPAIHTFENLVDELHLSFPSQTAEIPQHRLQSPNSLDSERRLLIVANFHLKLLVTVIGDGPSRGEGRRLPGA
jgi:hypothetical protein